MIKSILIFCSDNTFTSATFLFELVKRAFSTVWTASFAWNTCRQIARITARLLTHPQFLTVNGLWKLHYFLNSFPISYAIQDHCCRVIIRIRKIYGDVKRSHALESRETLDDFLCSGTKRFFWLLFFRHEERERERERERDTMFTMLTVPSHPTGLASPRSESQLASSSVRSQLTDPTNARCIP